MHSGDGRVRVNTRCVSRSGRRRPREHTPPAVHARARTAVGEATQPDRAHNLGPRVHARTHAPASFVRYRRLRRATRAATTDSMATDMRKNGKASAKNGSVLVLQFDDAGGGSGNQIVYTSRSSVQGHSGSIVQGCRWMRR